MNKHPILVRRFLRWLINFWRSSRLVLRRLIVLLSAFVSGSKRLSGASTRRICKPTPLPLQRLRRLTTSWSSEAEEVNSQVALQLQSAFFSILPSEIRRQIYLYTLGKKTIHIVPTPSRLGHIICIQRGSPNLNSHACWLMKMSGSHVSYHLHGANHSDVRRDGLLNMLQTSRRTYSEAVDLLYSANTFDLINPKSMVLLSEAVLPHRLNAIRSIHLSWIFCKIGSQEMHEWERSCSILSAIESLRHLRLQFRNESSAMTSLFEQQLLRPAWSVKLPEKWDIVTDWEDTGAEFKGAPFQVVRVCKP